MFFNGVLVASIFWLLSIVFFDQNPKELPMYDLCDQYEASLEAYDTKSFLCDNGARFNRDILDE